MPKAKLASVADSAAALSCWLLSPAPMLTPMLPEAPWATLSAADALLLRFVLLPSLPPLVWALSTMAIAAESMSMRPRTLGSPEMEMSESSFTFLSKRTPELWEWSSRPSWAYAVTEPNSVVMASANSVFLIVVFMVSSLLVSRCVTAVWRATRARAGCPWRYPNPRPD